MIISYLFGLRCQCQITFRHTTRLICHSFCIRKVLCKNCLLWARKCLIEVLKRQICRNRHDYKNRWNYSKIQCILAICHSSFFKVFSTWVILQSEERQVEYANVNLDIDIFVISEPKWLKFGLQAHFFKVFGHAKFQLSITSTFKVIKLLVKVTKYLH